jgi:hypothetical protein
MAQPNLEPFLLAWNFLFKRSRYRQQKIIYKKQFISCTLFSYFPFRFKTCKNFRIKTHRKGFSPFPCILPTLYGREPIYLKSNNLLCYICSQRILTPIRIRINPPNNSAPMPTRRPRSGPILVPRIVIPKAMTPMTTAG